MTEQAHILVVDDDTRLRDLLRKYLSENGYAVTTARDAAEARQHLAAISFDLLVLDVMMPGENGIQLTKSVREKANVPILLLTAMGEAKDRISGLESGADDYLPKPFEARELLLRIGGILRRSAPKESAPTQFGFGGFVFDISRGELRRGAEIVKLSLPESQLLARLASTPGEVVSREELANTGDISLPRTVDVQVTRLRRKIEDDPREPRYLQTVRGRGYVLWPD